jgi:hypothetical protein
MKFKLFACLFAVAWTSAYGQTYSVVERALNHRVLESAVEQRDANNRVTVRKGVYTELASGLMYEENGVLQPSKAEIQLFGDGAAARKGQTKVTFAPNISSDITIDLEARDGKRLQSRVVGLAFYDRATGQSTLFAEVKPAAGLLLPPNQVVYPNAFAGADADLLYTYTISKFEQFVILNERPAEPEEYGLNSATTQLEVWTEFLEPPAPQKTRRVFGNGLADEHLDFGAVKIGRGTAFSSGGEASPIIVGKAWQQIDGRDFLIEAVSYKEAKAQLDLLPPRQAANRKTPAALRATVQNGRVAPTRRLAALNPGKIEVAAVATAPRGFIIDYSVLTGSLTDYTFRGDTTYLIAGWVSVDGTPTIEGGAVFKYTNNAAATVSFESDVIFKTSEYSPAVFTCKDDNSIGETIAGSTGVPSGYYAHRALQFIVATQPIEYIRVSHATTAVALLEYDLPIRHSQVTFCSIGVDNSFATSTLEDVLMHRVETPFYGTNFNIRAQHLTVHECNKLTAGSSTNSTISLTNSLLVHMTNWGTSLYVTNSVAVVNDSAVFQTVGAGKHYLTTNSPYRNAGTTNISATLAADLKKRTTYPPIVAGHLTTMANTNLALSPQAGRDTDTPDLGWHYTPLDYAFGGTYLENASITINPGTAVAIYSPTNQSGGTYYGIGLGDAANLFSEGSPTNLNRIVRYNTVQEQSSTSWNTTPADHIIAAWEVPTAPQARFRFTEWSSPASESHHFRGHEDSDLAVPFVDCQFWGGKFTSERPKVSLTNSLFHRVETLMLGLVHEINPTFQNCLFYGGSLGLYADMGGTWKLHDNLFDRVIVSQSGTITHDYNGYLTNSTAQWLTNSGSHNVFTNTFTYENGALGRFYQPTNSPFLSVGSTNANFLGLYHYTVLTNNVKETNSIVDIGFHYVATTNGVPTDTDADGIPDYLEDANGNGIIDSGETDFNNSGDYGLEVRITRPKAGAVIP